MPRLESSVRHLAFFETLGRVDEASATWRAVSAGLLLLRLLDRLLEGGTIATDAAVDAAVDVPDVRAAAHAVDATDPMRAHLVGLADSLGGATSLPAIDVLGPPLLAWSRALDLAGLWALASDVARSVARHARPVVDAPLAIEATLRHARLARTLAELDLSAAAYACAGRMARESGDASGVLRAELGRATLAAERGNVPEAERIGEAVLRRARSAGLTPIVALALHQRAQAAHLRRDHEQAVRFAYEALQLTTDATNRMLVLSDVATAFGMLGVRSAARDTLLLVLACTTDQHMRWTTMINLMEHASLDGQVAAFEDYRRELEAAPLSPFLRANVDLHVGEALGRAGHVADADRALQRAIRLAERHRFNRVLFAAESARDALRRHEPEAPRAAGGRVPESLADVLDGLATLRRDTSASVT